MKRLIAAALLLLAACATPYQTGGFSGGVNAVPLGGDVYRVEAALNGFSSSSMLQDYLLLRAAETAQANGAIGFEIVSAQDTSTTGAFVTPGHATTTGSAYAYGNTAYGSSYTTYTPAQAYQYIRPGGILLIRLVRNPQQGQQFFSSQEIIAAIGPRVHRR